MMTRAVFLDRDGTLNFDPGYLHEPDKLELLPKVAESLRRLKDAGFLLVVVTNQSGVGRGYFPESALRPVHDRLDELLETAAQVKIDHYEYCTHRPDQPSEFRKPKPGMLFQAAGLLQIDLSSSFMVGDRLSDLEAGKNAGCQACILVKTGKEQEVLTQDNQHFADLVANDLEEGVKWILDQK